MGLINESTQELSPQRLQRKPCCKHAPPTPFKLNSFPNFPSATARESAQVLQHQLLLTKQPTLPFPKNQKGKRFPPATGYRPLAYWPLASTPNRSIPNYRYIFSSAPPRLPRYALKRT